MTVEIRLGTTRRCKHTGKYVALIDPCDEAWARGFNWTADLSRHGQRVYAVRRAVCADGIKRKVYMHREVWERAHGQIPAGLQVDHREHGDVSGLDNRRANLRLASVTQNGANQRIRKDNTSGYKGVSWSKSLQRWEAYVDCEGRRRRLGFHRSAEDAARSYDLAAIEVFGQFARTNFPQSAV